MKRLLPWFLSLLTGVAMVVGFPPYEVAWLSWMPCIAFTPLIYALLFLPLPTSQGKRACVAFLLGFFAGAIFFLLTLEWITSVAWEGLVTLPFYLAIYSGLWSLFVVMVVRPWMKLKYSSSLRNLLVAVFSAAAWTGLEWLRGTLFTGFGWNSFGVAFHHNIPLLQICDITGVGGLSFLGVMTGSITAIAVERFFLKIKSVASQQQLSPILRPLRPHADVALTLLLMVGVMSYGIREMFLPSPPQEQLTIAAVQGNIVQNHKWDRAFEAEIMATYVRESEIAAALHPDLILWPEAATPEPLLLNQSIFRQVQQLAEKSGSDFLIGSLHYEENPARDYNTAILLTKRASAVDYYAKTHLVAFGEYIPFRKSFPLFTWIVGDRVLGDFNAGPGPKLLELSVKPIKLASLLCFEDTLGDLVRRFAQLGAQALVTLTNDGWFGHTAASQQHLVNALFRCAETKLPLIRVANTGVTCVVNRFGSVVETLHSPDGSTFLEGLLSTKCDVPEHPQPTFYVRHGDLFAEACLVLSLIAVGLKLIRRKK
ncbi:MAG: apolipoprotein N-acyltransferase [Chthoniobacterales bacterium]